MKKIILSLLVSIAVASPLSAHTFWQILKPTGSVTATDQTPVNIPGLSWSVNGSATSGVYTFRCYMLGLSATTATNGIRYSLTGPADPYSVVLRITSPGTGGAFAVPATTVTQSYYATGATGYSGFTPNASDGGTTYHLTVIEGRLNNSVSGTVQLQVRSESTEDVTTSSGSWCELETPRSPYPYTPLG